MARREWAYVKGQKTPKRLGETDIEFCARVAKAEHARAVRIVKAQMKAAQLDQHTWLKNERDGYLSACRDILAMLTKGRA
jgi:hypothetical protein